MARQGAELPEVTMPAQCYKVTLEPDARGELEKLILLRCPTGRVARVRLGGSPMPVSCFMPIRVRAGRARSTPRLPRRWE